MNPLRRGWTVLALVAGVALEWLAVAILERLGREERARRLAARLLPAQARRLRRTAIRLQGLLIKVGQFLSTRVDVLPESFTSELADLQDVVPPAPWPAVRARLEQAYGRPEAWPFARVEQEPVAAASLAQVHRAWLDDGRLLALKILRPGIERLVRTDLWSLGVAARWAARWTSWGRRYDLLKIYGEFRETTLAELDLLGEAERARRFAANFAGRRGVRVPRVYRELSSRVTLAMSYEEGIPSDDAEAMRAAGIEPRRVALRLVRATMRQILDHGFFHADPHPGNLFVTPEGALLYLDFGMMGEVRPQDREAVARLLLALLTRDAEGVAEAVVALEFVRPGTDAGALRKTMAFAMERLLATDTARDPEAFVRFTREMGDFLYSHPFQLPARFLFLGRALGMVAGTFTRLAPGEDFMAAVLEAGRDLLLGGGSVARALGGALVPLRAAALAAPGGERRDPAGAEGRNSPSRELLLAFLQPWLRLPRTLEAILQALQSQEAGPGPASRSGSPLPARAEAARARPDPALARLVDRLLWGWWAGLLALVLLLGPAAGGLAAQPVFRLAAGVAEAAVLFLWLRTYRR
ncbi:MAG: AarF/UbiB family protein [Bacillota bacterium]|nr:AarF/UbiB family protein [Bacillota bacterium]